MYYKYERYFNEKRPNANTEIILFLFQSLCIINMNDILPKSDQKLGTP